ncbi:type II toxin-antitoxin system PemK/MazF family toxin [Pontibacter sp. E15-1]|uniref:type II toxin-antitoxin system PemK/MazF family toxin n=1 Tax=Pontibacter sp. E15-1 TaxID=2919918 RepID=UPI001F500DCD|nr:type II toxin-antitoxin system PemK/MazF family toxin [Pontibacter sp. E15-1]MCJ8164786.1 type II toxin-antitoxin system PemK/MazF family toxin [Pontibacter sp. E15-1]
MKKGDIVLIPFPFTDLTGQKNRPAAVLIASERDITVAFITSQIRWQEKYDVPLTPSGENGLKKPSLIRISKIATVERTLALGKLGSLADVELLQLNQNLIQLLQLA